jgi:hypothetical protein
MVEREIPYPKPKRLPIGVKTIAKNLMSAKDMAYLLSGKVVVEEKMDGRSEVFRSHDPPLIIFAEDLRRMHSIFYHLPGRYAVFDIFDIRRNVLVYPEEKLQLSKDLRSGKVRLPNQGGELFFPVPRIAQGRFSPEDLAGLVGESAYARNYEERDESAPGEGIVVKQFVDSFAEEFISGKIVRLEFLLGIEQNYLRLPYRANAINPAIEPVTLICGAK